MVEPRGGTTRSAGSASSIARCATLCRPRGAGGGRSQPGGPVRRGELRSRSCRAGDRLLPRLRPRAPAPDHIRMHARFDHRLPDDLQLPDHGVVSHAVGHEGVAASGCGPLPRPARANDATSARGGRAPHRASCCSRSAWCRAPTSSARSARATRWRSAAMSLICNELSGARWWIRTTDPRRVKAVLYR
jgi:hypothetical protein